MSDLPSRCQTGGFGQRVAKRLEVAGDGEDRVAVVPAIEGMIDQAIGDRAGESSHAVRILEDFCGYLFWGSVLRATVKPLRVTLATLSFACRTSQLARKTNVTSITLTVDDQTAEALRQLAALEQRSEADIVRTALAAYARAAQPRPKGIGKYRSGRSDVSVKARDLIRKDVKEGRWP